MVGEGETEGVIAGDADGPVEGVVDGRAEGVAVAVGRGEGSPGVWLGAGTVLPPPPPPHATRARIVSAAATPQVARGRMGTPVEAKNTCSIVAAAALPGQGTSGRRERALRAAASPTSARVLSDYGDKGVALSRRLITATPPPRK